MSGNAKVTNTCVSWWVDDSVTTVTNTYHSNCTISTSYPTEISKNTVWNENDFGPLLCNEKEIEGLDQWTI